MRRVIFHIDVNSAFLSWSAVKMLQNGHSQDVRTIPSVVGGDASKRRGIVLAKSISTKPYGIATGESLFSARQKCPSLTVIPPDYELYCEQSRLLCDTLKNYSPLLQRFSVDECFIDYTGMEPHFGEPEKAADLIRETIKNNYGWTVNVGIGPNKLLAKMASDFSKPDKTHTLFKDEIKDKMWPLPVAELFMVGYSTAKTLKALNINTIGELANTDIKYLERFFKSHGRTIWQFANGFDNSPVMPNSFIPVKGFSNSTTTVRDIYSSADAKKVLLSLSDSVALRMRRQGFMAGLIGIQIKNTSFESSSMQSVIDVPTDSTMLIYSTACALFDRLWHGEPLRHLGVRVSTLSPAAVQQQYLFAPPNLDKLRNIDKAVDSIRRKYGNDSISRAASLEMPLVKLTSTLEDTPVFGLHF